MDNLVDSRALPPPRERGLADALAILAVSAAALAMFVLTVALVVLATGGPRHDGGAVENQPLGAAVVAAMAAILFALTAAGLHRRRGWARRTVAAELAAGIGLLGLSIKILSQSHGRTDSSGMAGMSAAFCALCLLGLLVVVVLPANRNAFRPPGAGWFPDPGGRRVRWWDGDGWTDHIAD